MLAHRKGKQGEYEVRDILRKYFPETRIERTGSPERFKVFKGDINVISSQDHPLKKFFIEVKNQRKIEIFSWYKKAYEDAGGEFRDNIRAIDLPPNKIPLLIFSKGGKGKKKRWFCCLLLEHFLDILSQGRKEIRK